MRNSLLIGYICLFSCVLIFRQEAAAACTQPPVPSISSSGQLTICSGQSVTLTASSGVNYTYQWKKNGSNISGATNAAYIATASGSYTVVVKVDTCSNTSLAAVVTVNPIPNGTLTNDHWICQGSSTTLVAGGGVSYNWNAGGAVNNMVTVTPSSTTTYSVTVSNSYGCNDIESVEVTVRPAPQANVSVAGSSTLCMGQSVNLNTSNGTGYSHQWYKNNAILNGETNYQLNVNSTGDYHVVVTLDGCSKTSSIKTILVNPVPVAGISDDETICAGQIVNLYASGGTSYQWGGGGPATAGYDVAPNNTRTYSVTVTNVYGCTASDNVTITVKPLPNANISLSGSATLCNGQSVNLNASNGNGYSHQWYINNGLLGGETNPSYTASVSGNYHVVVNLDGCVKTSAPMTITVNPVPVAGVSPDVTICSGDSTTLTASGGTSYQWSSGGPSTASYLVTTTSSKTYTVTVSNSFGCSASASVIVTVKPLPNANISVSGGSTTLCNGQMVNLSASTGTGYSHQWFKENVALAGETNSIYTVSTEGEYHVVVSLNGCSKESPHRIFMVNELPNLQASDDTTICSGDSVEMFASGGTSYQWSSGGPSAPTFVVAPTSSKTYSVTVSNDFGCSAVANIVVTVKPLPQAFVSVSGSTIICEGQSVPLTVTNNTGYSHQWFKDSNTLIGETNNTYVVSAAGDYHAVVTLNGCIRESSHYQFTVNPVPIPQVSDDTTACSGDTVRLVASGGTNYQWNSGGPSTATYVLTPTSSKTYTVTVTNSYGCSAAISTVVIVKPKPNSNVSVSGSTTLCQGQSVNVTASNGTNYTHQWYKNNSALSGETNPGISVSNGGDYYAIVDVDGCSKETAHYLFTVNPVPVPVVSEDTITCAGSLAVLQASGGISYQWSSGGPASSTFVVAPVSSKTYTVTVTNSYGCSAADDVIVIVKPLPQKWISVSGSTTLCEGQSLTFNTANTEGHIWYRDGNVITGAASNSYGASLAGEYFVINSQDGCTDISDTISVSVNPLPVTGITNDMSVCTGDTVTIAATGGVSYKWNTGQTTSSIPVAPSSNRTYSVTITDANSCSVQENVTITTISLPANFVSIPGSSTFCADRTLTITASSGTGYTYQWFKNSLPLSGETNAQYTVAQSGNYFVKVSANGCSKNSNTTAFTVNSLPVVTASNDTTICSGDTIVLHVSGGGSYQWYNGNTSSSIQVAPTNNYNYSVTVSNSFGCSASESVTVSTITRPSAVASPNGTVSVCQGQSATLTASTGTGYSYQWMQDVNTLNGKTNQALDISTDGAYSVIVTQNGCSKKSNTVQVVVNPLPVASVSNDTTICDGAVLTLSAAGGNTYKWSTNSTSSSITVSPSATITYNVTVTSSSGCSVTKDVFIYVLPSPSASITSSGSLSLCQGQSVTFTASTGPQYFYQWKNNGANIIGQTGNTLTTTQAGNYAVAVSAFGCSKTSSVQSVAVNLLPTAVVSNDETICQGGTVSLIASGGSTYKWSNGRTSATNTVTPNQTSTYFVTVTDGNGCSDVGDVMVNVVPLPNAYISSSSSGNLCSGQTATLNASTGAGYTYIWYRDGVTIQGADASSYIVSQAGDYTVQTTSSGCSRLSPPKSFTVLPYLVATVSSDTTICGGESVTLSATGGNAYNWNTGDTTATIMETPSNSKTYSVTVSDGVNCSAVKSAVVTVNQLPNAFILVTGAVTSICDGTNATMTANSGTGFSYKWLKDGIIIPGETSQQYYAADEGSYTIEVTQNGCSRISPEKTIAVNPLPVVSLSKDVTICAGEPVTLHVSGGVSYQWNTYATDSVYTIATTSTKTYTVTATNSYGCKASDTVTVSTIALPTNVFLSSTGSTNICDGESVILKVGTTNGTSFQWQRDSVNIPVATSSTYEASVQGSYSLVVSGNGCSKTSSPLFVTVRPRPQTPEIVLAGEDVLESSVSGSNYKWFRNGLTFNVGSQQVKVTKSGVYTVYVTENNCQSDTSAPYYFYMTGIAQNGVGELMIYPNPNNGRFQVELPASFGNDIKAEVLNTLGQVVWSEKQDKLAFNSTHLTIDISELVSGIYLVNIQSDQKRFVGRVMVNR